MALAEPSRKREADDEHVEQVAKKVTKPSSEEQPQVQRLQTQLDAEQERAVSVPKCTHVMLAHLTI